jgi:hypothetical protein
MNGYELGELHDVIDSTTTSSYGDLLVKSGSAWHNSRQLTGSYAITGSLQATSFTGSLQGTASYSLSASFATSASIATSASFAPSPVTLAFACTDETSPITLASSSISLMSPRTFTLQQVIASVRTAQTTGSNLQVDVNVSGSSIMSSKVTIDNGQLTSLTSATGSIIASSSINLGDIITIDIDAVGTGATGLKIYLLG